MNKNMEPLTRYGIILRLITIEDAEFILRLRSDSERNKYISQTSPHLSDQITWIENYKIREKQGIEYYFVVHDMDEKKYGTIRLYNFDENSFEVGSWIFIPNSPLGIAVKTHIIGLQTGFELLRADYCKLTVRKKNIGVIKYLEDFKPIIIKEDDNNLYFILPKENFYYRKNKLTIFLQDK